MFLPHFKHVSCILCEKGHWHDSVVTDSVPLIMAMLLQGLCSILYTCMMMVLQFRFDKDYGHTHNPTHSCNIHTYTGSCCAFSLHSSI